jgi:hypothetical protein
VPSKDDDLKELEALANELDDHDLLYARRIVIWDRRHRAKDVSDSALARASRVARSQVLKGLQPSRVAKAKADLKKAKKNL